MLGFSLNLLTILAVVLSVGLVVDDAIVVVENVSRHMQEGRSRIEAALLSSRELLAPIIAMTFTPGRGIHPNRLRYPGLPAACFASLP